MQYTNKTSIKHVASVYRSWRSCGKTPASGDQWGSESRSEVPSSVAYLGYLASGANNIFAPPTKLHSLMRN